MGYFITVEGGEGCGKTSVLERVIPRLIEDGYTNIVAAREPGGIKISEQIREVILNKENTNMDPIAEALLFVASRRQLVSEKILPVLNNNGIFICDRYVDSNYVYQGYAGNVGVEKVIELNELAIGDCLPDLTIVFDLDPKIGLDRIARNHNREVNRLDLAKLDYHYKIREGYQMIAKRFPNRIVVVDASKSLEEVVDMVYNLIKCRLEEVKDERLFA